MAEDDPIKAIGATLDDAKVVSLPGAAAGPGAGGGGRGRDAPPPPKVGEPKPNDPVEYDDETGLPVGCPVKPLGIDGNVIYLLTRMRQVMALNGKDRSRNTIPALFAPDVTLPYRWWPRLKARKWTDDDGTVHEDFIVTGIKAEDLWDEMVSACARKGIWDPTNSERASGAWTLADGRLVFHVGDRLIAADEELPLGVVGKHVYTGARAIQRPWPKPVSVTECGLPLLDHFESWGWTRGTPGAPVDALLLLGWAAAARIGGALAWRPMAFVIGGAGTGKSTLHHVLKMLHRDDGVIYTTDTSAAALANLIGHSSRPVIVDELENTAHNGQRARQVVELARLAASGAPRTRSDPNQGVSITVARNAMLFDAILPPNMGAADRSRFAMLRLGPLPKDTPPLPEDPVYWDELGRKMMRRLLDHYPRFHATLQAFHERLRQGEHLRRSADQFATILAAAHLLLSDHAPDQAELDRWAERLAPEKLIDLVDAGDDAMNCIDHLSKAMPAVRFMAGATASTAQLCRTIMLTEDPETRKHQQSRLALAGMQLYRAKDDAGRVRTYADGRPVWLLGVANSHPGLVAIFAGTDWETAAAVTPGAWIESLRRLDGAENGNRRIDGRGVRMVLLPARQHVVDPWADDGGEED